MNIYHVKFHSSSLKNLDVTDLQTSTIIWSQVISAPLDKGNMNILETNGPPKLNRDAVSFLNPCLRVTPLPTRSDRVNKQITINYSLILSHTNILGV